LRKFRVRANFQKKKAHSRQIKRGKRRGDADDDDSAPSVERNFEILADDPDDAKVRVRRLLKREGYSEKSLGRITWTVSRLDRPRKK